MCLIASAQVGSASAASYHSPGYKGTSQITNNGVPISTVKLGSFAVPRPPLPSRAKRLRVRAGVFRDGVTISVIGLSGDGKRGPAVKASATRTTSAVHNRIAHRTRERARRPGPHPGTNAARGLSCSSERSGRQQMEVLHPLDS